MSTARLFFALWPDDLTRHALHQACRDALAGCGGRPVPPANYHLTLAFLGDVREALVPPIRAAAAAIAPPSPTLQLDRCGHFPGARVLWIGPGESPAVLKQLADRLWAAMQPLGLEPDARAFQPHVTIARNVRRAPRNSRLTSVAWAVHGFALIRSVTDSTGARYAVDQYFPEGSSNEP